MKIVEIDWIDSSSTAGWSDPTPSHPDTMNCKTIGFLIHEDKETVTVSAHVVRSGKYCHSPMSIPKCAIKKRRVLGVRK